MNQELKQLVLDICNKYPIYDEGVVLSIIGGPFNVTLSMEHDSPLPELQVYVNLEIVYRTRFKIDGDTILDKDVTEIYRLMQEKRRELIRQQKEIGRIRREREQQQQRLKMATDPNSLQAIAKLRAALPKVR